MTANDPMSIEERRTYLMKMERLYRKASKRERGTLLDEMEVVTGMHRKSLTKAAEARCQLGAEAMAGPCEA